MNSNLRQGAAWQRLVLAAALLPGLTGCSAATQRSRHDALALDWSRSAPVIVSTSAFAEGLILERQAVIDEVLLRNPTIEIARQAWREALARHPQVTALADPTLAYTTAPGTIGSMHGYGQVIRIGQRLEWPGKQALRGEAVLAESEARSADLEAVRLHLSSAASILFDDAFAAQRGLAINAAHRETVSRLRASAEARYTAGQGDQQDPIQADIELALLERERIALVSRQQGIAAQLNGLLHRPVEAALPPAPTNLEAPPQPDHDGTAAQRAEIRAAAHRTAAREHAVSLAKRAYYPDIEVSSTYSSMWQTPAHQWMVGVSLNLPIRLASRRGGVDEANASLARARAEQTRAQIDVDVEVRRARIALEEARATATLYETQLLPAATLRVAAAESNYTAGMTSFSELMTAQRQLRAFEHEAAEAIAETWRRHALLRRATGTVPTEGGAR